MELAWISFRTQPHKRAEVLSAVDEMVERMRHMDGCVRGRLLADSEDANGFTLVSEWQSKEHVDAFLESRDFHLFHGMRMLLRGEPVIVLDHVEARRTKLLREQ